MFDVGWNHLRIANMDTQPGLRNGFGNSSAMARAGLPLQIGAPERLYVTRNHHKNPAGEKYDPTDSSSGKGIVLFAVA